MHETIMTETIAALQTSILAYGSPLDRVTTLDADEGEVPILLEAATVESARRIAREAIADKLAGEGVRLTDLEAYWDGSQTRGRIRLLVPSDERLALAEDLARWAGQDAERVHDEDVASQSEGRHYTYCCTRAREEGERNEYAFALGLPPDKLRHRHAAELADAATRRKDMTMTKEALTSHLDALPSDTIIVSRSYSWTRHTTGGGCVRGTVEQTRHGAAEHVSPPATAPDLQWSWVSLDGDSGETRDVWIERTIAASTTIPQPTPADATMTVGTGEAKEMPPGLAEELAGMDPGDRAVAQRVSDLAEIEPAPGYEHRVVVRARREGVI